MSKIYVGNLPYNLYEDELADLFAQFGTVQSDRICNDRETGRSKGFGFVEMSTPAEAGKAIEALNQSDLKGRPLTVSEAKPQPPRAPREGGYGRY